MLEAREIHHIRYTQLLLVGNHARTSWVLIWKMFVKDPVTVSQCAGSRRENFSYYRLWLQLPTVVLDTIFHCVCVLSTSSISLRWCFKLDKTKYSNLHKKCQSATPSLHFLASYWWHIKKIKSLCLMPW